MKTFDILVKDRNTNMYKKVGISLATSKKGALTEYLKTMYINLIKNKDTYSIKKYEETYGKKITRYGFSMSERDLSLMLSNLHPHIVIPSQDFKAIKLSESEIKNLAKAVKTPKKGLKLSESARTEVANAFKQYREDVKAIRSATNKPTATKKAVSKRVITKKK